MLVLIFKILTIKQVSSSSYILQKFVDYVVDFIIEVS